MSRRSLAIVIAAVLESALILAMFLVEIPYVRLYPGTTVDVLSEVGGEERITVEGHKAYYGDGGELRMTTVAATRPEEEITIFTALQGWLNDEEAVKPHDLVYSPDETDESSTQKGAQQMQSSQDYAVAVALRELGFEIPEVPVVSRVVPGLPADGALSIGDQILAIDGTRTRTPEDVVEGVQAHGVGEELAITVRRAGRKETYEIAPADVEGDPRVGIEVGVDYEFPFEVNINVGEDIGGPSAGLMFALAVYDTLTPGSLTGGRIVAGTGEIDGGGNVRPIGGIEQKIVGARDAGAELFLVPADNCDDAVNAPNEDVTLVRVETFKDARAALDTWVEDPGAKLPSCEDAE